jgi:hypothetical protein
MPEPVICLECDGEGVVACPECGTEGAIDCDQCDGTGYLQDDDELDDDDQEILD